MRLVFSSTTLMAALGIASAFNTAGRILIRSQHSNVKGSFYKISSVVPFADATQYAPSSNVWGKHSTSTKYGRNYSTKRKMSDSPFTTWTFDKACESMDWSELSSAKALFSKDLSTLEDSDLVILGVYAPACDDEDEENNDSDKEEVAPILEGKVKEIDESLGGALTDLMVENAKTFKAGAAFGKTTPTLRMVTSDGSSKVSKQCFNIVLAKYFYFFNLVYKISLFHRLENN